ncbi:hypothetical protein DSO57_1037280 [Entomophthora muscae]|uniref:Uncharacterized protein n=1 Tax=Entomophthora muscae TaxID=34485 RepID=A0ACC2RDV3_9FUNG|nr:hypothetical protein DSO57_1037280 [Entomophthora muscae]
MAIVFPGVARPKRCHPGKPGPKPRPLAVIVDLNLTINHKWVVVREIGSEWGADAPHPIFPSLTCWSTNPDLKGGQEATSQDVPKGFKFVITRLLDSAFSPLQFPGNLPPPAEMIPETHEIECEPIYAADSLMLSQMKVFLMYLCIIFCCTFPYSLFKGYHLRVNTYRLLLIGLVVLIWVYIPHLIDYNELSLYFTLTIHHYLTLLNSLDLGQRKGSIKGPIILIALIKKSYFRLAFMFLGMKNDQPWPIRGVEDAAI